ncbi:MAG: radical SAM protein [Candidatus Binatia bacterium]|nr:MAG: radical SAM protein [Candidatus Binatia bacterium]
MFLPPRRQPSGLFRRWKSFRVRNRYLTPRRIFNYFLVHAEMKLGRTRLRSRPYRLCVDVTNRCNLGCPFCPTGRKEAGRPPGDMDFSLFREIVDELAPYVMSVELFNWGEPFFHRGLADFVAYANSRRIVTLVSSNLSFRLREETARRLVESGLTYLTASVDGADQRSYEVYRRGGKFPLVLENLRLFVRLKHELGTDFPRLWWQYLVFAHNEGRVEEARRLATELGLDAFSAMGGIYEDPAWAPSREYDLPFLELDENRCRWLWTKAVFHWDGGMASCCMGFYAHDDFGVWRRGNFGRLWNNEKFVRARRIWTEPDSPLPESHFCTACDKVRLYRGLPLASPMSRARESRKVAAA